MPLSQKCRQCGCTEEDCTQCVKAQGEPCYWVEPDLCSRCRTELSKFNGAIHTRRAMRRILTGGR